MLRTIFVALALALVSATARAEPDLDRYYPSASTDHGARQHAAKRHRWHRHRRVARHQTAPRLRVAATQRAVIVRPVPMPRPRPETAPTAFSEAGQAARDRRPVDAALLAELRAYVVAQEQAVEALPPAPVPAVVVAPLVNLFAEFRSFIVRTATAGGTMIRQGRDKAVECLHPRFAERLAGAIREARLSGLPRAGVFSACRPPGMGVGGFRDKFMSMHAYGLAVDMAGVGKAYSRESKLWNVIATRHKLYNPYFGTRKWFEHNHIQPTGIKLIARAHPLRKTITARGPTDLERMWKMAEPLIDKTEVSAQRRARKRYAGRVL